MLRCRSYISLTGALWFSTKAHCFGKYLHADQVCSCNLPEPCALAAVHVGSRARWQPCTLAACMLTSASLWPFVVMRKSNAARQPDLPRPMLTATLEAAHNVNLPSTDANNQLPQPGFICYVCNLPDSADSPGASEPQCTSARQHIPISSLLTRHLWPQIHCCKSWHACSPD